MLGLTVHGDHLTLGTAAGSAAQSMQPNSRKLILQVVVIMTIAVPLFLILGAIGFCIASYLTADFILLSGALACALTAILFVGGLCCSYTSHENAYREEFYDYPGRPIRRPISQSFGYDGKGNYFQV